MSRNTTKRSDFSANQTIWALWYPKRIKKFLTRPTIFDPPPYGAEVQMAVLLYANVLQDILDTQELMHLLGY